MSQPSHNSRVMSFIESVTGILLLLVQIAIGWMVLATWIPNLPRYLGLEAEVAVMVGLLFATLILVSVVALWHTRK